MSGHSKWSTIRRKKEILDSKKGKVFTKISKAISVAVKQGGDDLTYNSKLRLAILEAKKLSMPKENIEKAIHAGKADKTNYSTVYYEGKVTGGATFIVECLTDNQTRTVAEVRAAFSRHNGKVVQNGSVTFMFNFGSFFDLDVKDCDFDDVFTKIIEYDIIDINEDRENGCMFITAKTDKFGEIQKVIESIDGVKIKDAGLGYCPDSNSVVEMEGEDLENAMDLIDKLEDLDDVQKVFSNVVEKD